MTEPEPTSEILFAESGASWLWLLAGPAAGLAMFLIQLNSGLGVRWVVPLAFFLLVSSFLALQIKAARIHTSVELTPEALREGTETILVDEIVALYPEPPAKRSYERGLMKPNAMTNRAMKRAGFDEAELAAAAEPEDDGEDDAAAEAARKWQSARAIGELTGVPRGRTGIGLKLTGGRTAQAWARDHRGLRAALTRLVEARP